MPTKYYMGFASSAALEQSTIELLQKAASGTRDSLVPNMERALDLFVPELMQAFLVGTVDVIGLSPMATKMVHSTADIIDKTAKMLVGQLLKKRSNEELKPLVGFVDDIYLRPETTSTGKASTACEISKHHYDRIKYVTGQIQSGNIQPVLPELHELMGVVVDTMLEQLMKRPISMLPLNFVVRKIADGAISTCKAAGHGVVNKVFKKLDDDQVRRMADYFDSLILTAERA